MELFYSVLTGPVEHRVHIYSHPSSQAAQPSMATPSSPNIKGLFDQLYVFGDSLSSLRRLCRLSAEDGPGG